MRKSFSKYLTILILLSLSTLILVSSRKVGNTNTPNPVEISNIDNNLDISKTKDNLSPVQAEQVGSSPESGATSRLKQVHDWLVAKSDPDYGGTQPADWSFNFGTYWNRMLYSAFWEPDGNATESDVLQGKTFYSGLNNRVKKTGTLTPATSPGAYYEQFVQYDDNHASDYQGEESTWINTNSSAGNEVWYDTRTGLYWNRLIGVHTNGFNASTCEFYNLVTYPTKGLYGTSGTDPDCGNAINRCAVLSLAAHENESANTDWYLPTYKELDTAFIDGIFNQAGSTFTTSSRFWSSTAYSSNEVLSWYEYLYTGRTYYAQGSANSFAVMCVKRD